MDSITPTSHIDPISDPTFIDVISIDMFRVVIPIFVNMEEMLDAVSNICPDTDTSSPRFDVDGMALLDNDKDGCPVFAVYLHPESTADVWVHEASHLVDMVFDVMNIDPGWEATETRAYMLQYIFTEMCRAMAEWKEKLTAELEPKGITH